MPSMLLFYKKIAMLSSLGWAVFITRMGYSSLFILDSYGAAALKQEYFFLLPLMVPCVMMPQVMLRTMMPQAMMPQVMLP
jgi:hypothetical protein